MKKIIIALIFLLPIIALLAMTLSIGIVSEAVVISADRVSVFYKGEDVSDGITLILGDDAEFTVEIYPRNAENKEVNWDFDNSIFSMPHENVLHAKKVGTSYVTVRVVDGGAYVSFFVNVVSANLDIVTNTTSLAQGESDFLEISHSSIDVGSIKWSSSDESVLFVDSGKITAKKSGTAQITVTARLSAVFNSDEILSASKTFTVTPRLLLYGEITVDTETVELASLASATVISWNLDGAAFSDGSLDCSALSYGEHTLTAQFIEGAESVKIIKKLYAESEKFRVAHLSKFNAKLFPNEGIINLGEMPSVLFEIEPVFYRDKDTAFSVDWILSETTAKYLSEKYKRSISLLFTESGEIVIEAKISSDIVNESLTLNYIAYMPVEIFSLALDVTGDKLGIKEERVFATESYLRDKDGKLIADEESGYMKTNERELKIGYFYPQNARQSYEVVVSDESIIRVVDKEAKIILAFLKEGTATVTVSVKNSAFGKVISDSYTFLIKEGVAVSSSPEFENAVGKNEKALIFTANIATEVKEDLGTWDHDRNENTPEVPRSAEYYLHSSIYGNGFMISPNYEYYNDYSFFLLTQANDLTIENLTVRIKNNSEKGDVLSGLNNYGTCMRICHPNTGGKIKNVKIRFCRFENGLSGVTGAEEVDEDNPVLIEGCIFKNFLQCGFCLGFESGTIAVILKNCIAYNIQCPVIYLYTYKPDLGRELYFNLKFEGFFDNYNWREKDKVELIGNLTGDESIDSSVKNLVNQKLNSAELSDAYFKYKGVDYLNPLMMILTNTAFTTYLGDQFDYMTEMGFERFIPNLGPVGTILDMMNKQNVIYLYPVYCNRSEKNDVELPHVLPDTVFIENPEMRRQLREGRNGN